MEMAKKQETLEGLMSSNIHYVKASEDRKVGKDQAGATYSSYLFCPRSNCPWASKCYGRHYPCCLHANNVTRGKTGTPWQALDAQVRGRGLHPFMIRVNVTGDMCKPGTDDLWRPLVEKNYQVFKDTMILYTYTHAKLTKKNTDLMREMGEKGFTINASCETFKQVKTALKAGVPAVLTVKDQAPGMVVKDGIKYVTCPNASDKSKTCANCRLCTKFKREYVVVLPFHGANPKEVPPDFLMDHV